MNKHTSKIELVRELFNKGLSDEEIAKRLNLSVCTVRVYRWNLGLFRRKKKKMHNELDDTKKNLIKILNEAGFNDSEIAAILNISVSTVKKYRVRFGLKPVGATCCSIYTAYTKRMKDKILLARKFKKLSSEKGIIEAARELGLKLEDVTKMQRICTMLDLFESCADQTQKFLNDLFKTLLSSSRS